MKFFNLNLLLLLVLISCNKIENNESTHKPKKSKKSIIVGDAKYDGPEKYMYYHAAIKHGDVDVNKPSRFRSYKSDYKRVELEKALKRLNNNNYSRSTGNPNPSYSTYAKDNAVFIERGPYNAPGRTRAFIVDASDPSKGWLSV